MVDPPFTNPHYFAFEFHRNIDNLLRFWVRISDIYFWEIHSIFCKSSPWLSPLPPPHPQPWRYHPDPRFSFQILISRPLLSPFSFAGFCFRLWAGRQTRPPAGQRPEVFLNWKLQITTNAIKNANKKDKNYKKIWTSWAGRQTRPRAGQRPEFFLNCKLQITTNANKNANKMGGKWKFEQGGKQGQRPEFRNWTNTLQFFTKFCKLFSPKISFFLFNLGKTNWLGGDFSKKYGGDGEDVGIS